jgi:hypothetical protein
VDLANPTRPDNTKFHALLLRGADPSAARPQKEYTFHIDLGIEFLFHSGDPERRQAGHSAARCGQKP